MCKKLTEKLFSIGERKLEMLICKHTFQVSASIVETLKLIRLSQDNAWMGDHLGATTGMFLDHATAWRRVGSILFWPLNGRSILCWSLFPVKWVLAIQPLCQYMPQSYIEFTLDKLKGCWWCNFQKLLSGLLHVWKQMFSTWCRFEEDYRLLPAGQLSI